MKSEDAEGDRFSHKNQQQNGGDSNSNSNSNNGKRFKHKKKELILQFPRNTEFYASLPKNYGTPGKVGDAIITEPPPPTTPQFCTGKRKRRRQQQLQKQQQQQQQRKIAPMPLDKQRALMMSRSRAYGILDESSASVDDHDAFGLSNNLSTESIKQACGFYDDELSDDDLIEVHRTPECFQKSPPSQQTQSLPPSQQEQIFQTPLRRSFMGHKKRKSSEENPLCVSVTSVEGGGGGDISGRDVIDHGDHSLDDGVIGVFDGNNDDGDGDGDDALRSVLNELDAILDVHGAAQLNTSASIAGSEADTKVEDCLLELDNYLEEMDDCTSGTNDDDDESIDRARNSSREVSPQKQMLMFGGAPPRKVRTLPKNRNGSGERIAEASDSDSGFQRGHGLRKTISCGLERSFNEDLPLDISVEESLAENGSHDVWQRSSIRRSSPIAFPYSAEDVLSKESPSMDAASSGAQDLRRCFSQNDFGHRPPPAPVASSASASTAEMLTPDDIFNNHLIQNAAMHQGEEERPRQFGRRLEGHPRVLSLRTDLMGECSSPVCTIVSHDARPMSAPAATNTLTGSPLSAGLQHHHSHQQHMNSALYIGSEPSSARSSHNASPISLVSSSDSSSMAPSTNDCNIESTLVTGESFAPRNTILDPDNSQMRGQTGFNNEWPHSYSRTLALICCSLGLFNICRFAVLTVHYGGNFLLQFLLLSILFGIPMFWLQMCLGSKIKAGPVSMWSISPICRGIGIALALVQCLIGIYSTVGIAWLMVYLRDSFPTETQTNYRWMENISPYNRHTGHAPGSNLTESVADYFNIIVLQRLQFLKSPDGSAVRFRVNDRLAFNLAVIWAIIFLILCKGLKSFGKMVFILGSVPLIMLAVVTGKLLYVVDPAKLQNIFTAADFEDFLVNSKTWAAAAQETFLTWMLLGASVVAISSRVNTNSNSKTTLRRDAILVVLVTLLGLILAALLGLACVQILNRDSYIYVPGSYEHPETYTAVYSLKASISDILSYPPKWVPHYSSFIGETYRRPSTLPHRESGYQALRFVSELFPAVLALASDSVSWVWAAVAFTMFILFGLAQLCVIWKPISCALGNSTSSVLLSCVTALLLGIPFATEIGISILHYMDLLLGGAWFIPILWAAQIFGVFLIRGRPYNGDDLVNDLRMSASMSAFLALSWNVLMPIGLIALAVMEYKISFSNQFYYWRGKSYFSYWSRKVAGLTQIGFLLLVPIAAIVQIYRYMTRGPPDILDRIQLLYRPSEGIGEGRRSAGARRNRENNGGSNGQAGGGGEGNLDGSGHQMAQNDAPPKYTPPPSYTTATGARLAKLLRQSIRRSVRRILGDPGRSRPIFPVDAEMNQQSLPPDYSSVLTHPSGNVADEERGQSQTDGCETIEIGQRPVGGHNVFTAPRSLTLGRKMSTQKQRWVDSEQRPASASRASEINLNITRPYTAEDVVSVLRSSTRGRPERSVSGESSTAVSLTHELNVPQTALQLTPPSPSPPSPQCCESSFRSIENLIMNAEPPGQSPAVLSADHGGHEENHKNNNTSVI